MPPLDHDAIRAMQPALVAVACVLAIVVGVNAVVSWLRSAPGVGDIVAFLPNDAVPADEGGRLLVHRRDQSVCVLDLRVLRRFGGSVVVEARTEDGPNGFGAHWVGARTSDDARNCGSDVELTVDHRDLDLLALSAGGYGVGAKRLPVITGELSNFGE